MEADIPTAMELRVERAVRIAQGVVSLRLVATDGSRLPLWTAGAHLDLTLPSGLIRQFSLCGDPDDHEAYEIAVLRDDRGRGGSVEVHDRISEGTLLLVRGPRNQFALEPADRYLFVAGGIGVTPMLAMARQADIAGIPWTMYYGGRTRSSMAFIDDLLRLNGRVEILPEDENGLLPLETLLAESRDSTLYCCGPEPLLTAITEICERIQPGRDVHLERFAPSSSPQMIAAPDSSDRPFDVELRRSGITISVGTTQSILEAVREVIPNVLYSCEDGYCGTCEVEVLGGIPDHRDEILSAAEKQRGDRMFICVSRSQTSSLALDL